MRLLVVRHAIAIDQEDWSGSDAQRPLTDGGREKMKQGVAGLRRIVETIDLLGASPLVRAQQTAEILADAYRIKIKTVPALAPGQSPTAVTDWLEGEAQRDVIAAVGHEPSLSSMISWLVTGTNSPILDMKKGGVCLLDLSAGIGPGSASLLWLLWPGHLRLVARP
jgi:phosphohistidine phosphatase